MASTELVMPKMSMTMTEGEVVEILVAVGDQVTAGQQIGQIHSLEHPDRPTEPVIAQSDGILFARRSIPLSRQGECLAVLTREVDE